MMSERDKQDAVLKHLVLNESDKNDKKEKKHKSRADWHLERPKELQNKK
jgi:hypothetical protein